MLTLMQHTTNGLSHPFPTLEALLAEPFPRTPQDMMQLEQQLATAAAQTADQIMLVQVTRAHEDEAFVRQAIAQARAQRAVPLVHKGLRTTSVLLLGGTRLILETPYLREDRRGRRGRRRGKRGARGTGCYPVLECLGIAERVSPASRSEIALHMVQAASYLEAAHMLSPRPPLRRAPVYAMPPWRPPCVSPSPPMARWPASESVSVLMAAACARGARTVGARRLRDATALQHPGASHGCW